MIHFRYASASGSDSGRQRHVCICSPFADFAMVTPRWFQCLASPTMSLPDRGISIFLRFSLWLPTHRNTTWVSQDSSCITYPDAADHKIEYPFLLACQWSRINPWEEYLRSVRERSDKYAYSWHRKARDTFRRHISPLPYKH